MQPLGEIANDWLKATGKRLIKIPIPAVGSLKTMAKGYNCAPENAIGKITWRDWLAKRYP